MFHYFHRKNWFPAVVVGLSVLLLVFVIWAYVYRNASQETIQQVSGQPAINTDDYRQGVKSVLGNFWSEYSAASSVTDKLLLVERAEDSLLSFRVPAENRTLHLELAGSLELMRSGLAQDDNQKLEKGLSQLEAIFVNNVWLGAPTVSL